SGAGGVVADPAQPGGEHVPRQHGLAGGASAEQPAVRVDGGQRTGEPASRTSVQVAVTRMRSPGHAGATCSTDTAVPDAGPAGLEVGQQQRAPGLLEVLRHRVCRVDIVYVA
ncbi:MAG TPA: hypothetical protein VJ352_04740, partial [Geodermatophilus sp.]|nr:hypothetical protein [Geodermatophilus sp.]